MGFVRQVEREKACCSTALGRVDAFVRWVELNAQGWGLSGLK